MLKHRNKTVLPDYFVIDSPLTEQKISHDSCNKVFCPVPCCCKRHFIVKCAARCGYNRDHRLLIHPIQGYPLMFSYNKCFIITAKLFT